MNKGNLEDNAISDRYWRSDAPTASFLVSQFMRPQASDQQSSTVELVIMDNYKPPDDSIDYGGMDTLQSSGFFSRSNSWPNGTSFDDSSLSPIRMRRTSSVALRKGDIRAQTKEGFRLTGKHRESHSSDDLDIDGDLKSFEPLDVDFELEERPSYSALLSENKRLKDERSKAVFKAEVAAQVKAQVDAQVAEVRAQLDARVKAQVEAQVKAQMEVVMKVYMDEKLAQLAARNDYLQPGVAILTEKSEKLERKVKVLERHIAIARSNTANSFKALQENMKGVKLICNQRGTTAEAMIQARHDSQVWDLREMGVEFDKLENILTPIKNDIQQFDQKIMAIENNQKRIEQRSTGLNIEGQMENDGDQGASADLTSWPLSTPASN